MGMIFSYVRILGKMTLLLLAIFLLVYPEKRNAAALNSTKDAVLPVSKLRVARIKRHLGKINKPPVLTIQSPDGDIIDCVHRRKQPALDHPLLHNHRIQRVKPEMPKRINSSTHVKGSGRLRMKHLKWQTWHQKGAKCPRGTVPIRRSTVDDVLRAKSLFHYGKKRSKSQPPFFNTHQQLDPPQPDVVSGNGHEHAIAYTRPAEEEEVYGAKATMNVWSPSIEMVNEFSLSQIWVLSGSFDGTQQH